MSSLDVGLARLRSAASRVSTDWGRFNVWFKAWLPKGLYARALLIIIAPMVILQSVVAFVFMERHWNLVTRNLDLLRRSLGGLPPETQADAKLVLERQHEILDLLRRVHQVPLNAKRTRCHGDLHLGQVLHTGTDFIIIDFEGEPSRSLGERRIKRSPLRDVAGMIRSFDYAAHAALLKQGELGALSGASVPALESWARFWYCHLSTIFLRAYFQVLDQTDLLPSDPEGLGVLLNAQLLEKAVYELGYELNNRPSWVRIPLRGIVQLLEVSGGWQVKQKE